LLHGVMFVVFSIAIAAAEAAVGLALIIAVYRHYKTTDLSRIDTLKG
jgi:NADH:ubiquinone oxidoreductase subunit K